MFRINRYYSSLLINIALFCFYTANQVVFAELASNATQLDILEIDEFVVEGNDRTSPAWLESYLGIKLPMQVNAIQLQRWREKLLTAGVFMEADFRTQKQVASNTHLLKLQLREKWTWIPVLKGDFGGGTPVQTYGTFDTHAFGWLWTVGALAKKFGDAPFGYSLFFRAPRWLDGTHYLALDLYKNFRIRTFYDQEYEEFGQLYSNQSKVRLAFLNSVLMWNVPIQFGFNAFWYQQNRPTLLKGSLPAEVLFSPKQTSDFWFIPTIVYDDVKIYNLNYDGMRLSLKNGPIFRKNDTDQVSEIELFYYKLLPQNFSTATHIFAGQYTGDDFEQLYYLGGLDSIRGLPDGALIGKSAFYTNAEFYYLAYRSTYVWAQLATFVDSGQAQRSFTELFSELKTSLGAGVRISFPYVSRLTLRIDYAFNTQDSDMHGISMGLNSLFEPYKPLE